MSTANAVREARAAGMHLRACKIASNGDPPAKRSRALMELLDRSVGRGQNWTPHATPPNCDIIQ